MKKPLILSLSGEDRRSLHHEISASNLSKKGIIVDTLAFVEELMKDLEASKISISKLRSLLGFRKEALKEVLRNQQY